MRLPLRSPLGTHELDAHAHWLAALQQVRGAAHPPHQPLGQNLSFRGGETQLYTGAGGFPLGGEDERTAQGDVLGEGGHRAGLQVLDVSDAQFDNFKDAQTRQLTRRRYIHDKLDQYVMDLRNNNFTVQVFENNIIRLAQKEADMVARLTEEAAKPGSTTEQRIEELNKLIGE